MTITVKVRFDNTRRDENLARGVTARIPTLEKFLKKSSKPYRIQEILKSSKKDSRTYGNRFNYSHNHGWDFYVDEFFEQAVKDTIMTLDMDDDEWVGWFSRKYELNNAK